MTDTSNQTEPTDPTPTPAAVRTAPKRSRRRTLLISGGAVLAAAVLVGGGVAVGSAIADENDDDGDATSESTQRDDDGSADSDTTAAVGAASADELLAIIETASAEAEGEPVGIDDGGKGAWNVDFVTTAGEETEVRIGADGNVVAVSTETADQDEQAPEGALDSETLEALVKAALAHTDGTVLEVEIDSDTASPYDVTVLTPDRKTVDIALDSDFAVLPASSDDTDDD